MKGWFRAARLINEDVTANEQEADPREVIAQLDLSVLAEGPIREAVRALMNLVEELQQKNGELRAENQRLRDEISRLKGEQGKPDVKPNKPKAPPGDYSSERERREPKEWSKGTKNENLKVTREQPLEVPRGQLPADAEFKGYEEVLVQDLHLEVEVVRFRKQKWYSPSQGKTYLASVPPGYEGGYGPGIKSLVLSLAYGANMSHELILSLLRGAGIQISEGELSGLLTQGQGRWHEEAAAITQEALRVCPWQELDDTSTRVDGKNEYCQVLTSPVATSYRTTATKDRLAVVDVLRNGRPRAFLVNSEADAMLAQLALSEAARQAVAQLPRETVLDEPTVNRLLGEDLSQGAQRQRKQILGILAVAAYHAEVEYPIVRLLLTDDAPQFDHVVEEMAGCWVHEGRHYKKLIPYLPQHQALLEDFRGRYWDLYRQLLAYKASPSEPQRGRIWEAFEKLFATRTGYEELDKRIGLTRQKKAKLLAALDRPEVPLNTNDAERGARRRVRKRDVSFGPRSEQGKRAWDTFQTVAATAAQHGVSFLAYLRDRITQAYRLPSLVELIRRRAQELRLGASWEEARAPSG